MTKRFSPKTNICNYLLNQPQLEMQKNMFFSNHVFYAKKKSVFYRKKQFFNVFFVFFNYRKIFN